MESMTAEALRAQIEATRQRRQAAEDRLRSLRAETQEAEERQRLRRELVEEHHLLFDQEEDIRDEIEYRHLDLKHMYNFDIYIYVYVVAFLVVFEDVRPMFIIHCGVQAAHRRRR